MMMRIMSWNISCCITLTLLTCFLSSSARVSGLGETSMQQQQQQVVTYTHHHQGIRNIGGGHLNLSFIQELDKNCPQYCSDQLQYNSICVNQGCKQWKTGLRDGCGVVCNGSEANFQKLYSCQMGCSRVVEDYYDHLTGILGVPDPPTLIAVSLKSTSLRLSWEGSLQSLPYLVFTIQRRFYHQNHPWESVTTEPLNQTSFTVEGLKPYTEYQFRVGWILAQDSPPFYSLGSNRIETLPKGLPSSPEITSVQPISNISVAVTWLPPAQPNGPLLAFVLKLQNLSQGLTIKEIPMSQNPRGYTFSGLLPNTNYTLTILARNMEGEGDAASVSFVTPQSSVSNDISKKPDPRLLIQGIQDVYLQQLDPLLEPDIGVFVSNQNITAMAVHFKRKWVYIGLADGQVIRTELEGNQSIVILSKERLDIWVTFLSVDWLNQKLYLVGKKKRSSAWCIQKCELNGDKLTTVYSYLEAQPVDFMADPYTGFLYWVSARTYSLRGGLYKLDLIGEDMNGRLIQIRPIPVLVGSDLGPFTIDFANYRILIVHRERNTVLSVSLNGDLSDMRPNTQSPQFGDVQSLAMYDGIFYWTTGQSLVIEEYNSAENSFYHNSYDVSKAHQPCSRLTILHPDLQPIPVPRAEPRLPQVIFSQRVARVVWKSPQTIANLGEGAWKDWKYEIRHSDNTSISNISETEYVLKNLKPSTYYSIQVLAYSASGRGPLSVPFQGLTLRESPFNVSVLWGTEEGLYSTNALGEDVQRLVFRNQWKESVEDWTISTLAWHDSSVFFGISNGTVFHYDGKVTTSLPATPTRLRGISFAQSLAYDYIGEKLYWSNPKKQAILRCSIRDFDVGSPKFSSEWLQIVTMAKEIAIDSYNGLLLWTTGHSLELSRLNGYNHKVLYSIGFFSGVEIIGITLDTDQSRIYWISRSHGGSTLMKLNYNTKTVQSPSKIENYPDTAILGPIRYFNDRLIWLQGSSEAVITDLYGQGKSSMTVNSITNISTLHVIDQSAYRYPPRLSKGKLNVTPNSVLSWSIVVSGKWNNFTISWQPVNNTNFGKLFYEVTVNNYTVKPSAQPVILFENGTLFKPYTEIEIAIVALNYWTSSRPTIVKRHTPSGKPSEPLNPRIFFETLTYPYSKPDRNVISGELRWDSIAQPNGIILGYMVHCWKDLVKTGDCFCQVDLKKLNCELKNLNRSSAYQFAVQGYTDAGAGNWSRRVQSNPSFSNPIPKLLLTSIDKLQILDVDRNELETIPSGSLTPMTATYMASDDTLYWFNEEQVLFQSRLDGSNKTKILSLDSMEASHLSADWIARKLYWIAELSQTAINQHGDLDEKYRIMSLDLSDIHAVPYTMIRSLTAIKSIAVNPFRNSILWTTSRHNGIMSLYTSLTDGSLVQAFLSRDSLNCNCSAIRSIGEAIVFDPKGYGNIKQGIVITDLQSIWLADETGCECHQIINMSAHGVSRPMSPPFRIAVDEHHVYWTSNYLYASEKPGIGITELNGVSGPYGVREVLVIGPSVQPYPDLQCLLPLKLKPAEPVLLNCSSHAFHVQLPLPFLVNCSIGDLISMSTPKYEVYYGTVNEKGITECTPSSLIHCRVLKSMKPLLDITNLQPYTTYTVFVTVTNYYAEAEGLPSLISSPTMLRTAEGAPMPPKLLRLDTLTPTSVRVVWGRPEKLNGETVWYEVQWQACSPSKPSEGRILWREKEPKSNQNQTEYSLDITVLNSLSNYSVWVNAYSEKGDAFSPSEIRIVETFPNPNNLTLISATPHTLTLAWMAPEDNSILSHQIIYRVGWDSVWNETELVDLTVAGRSYNLTVVDLKPNTVYGFHIKAWYRGDPLHPYIWPREGQFNMETRADKPGSPGIPVARGIGQSLYEVTWEKADENGAVVDLYNLECKLEAEGYQSGEIESTSRRRKREVTQTIELAEKLVSSNTTPRHKHNPQQWFVVYNGTESRWQVKDLDLNSHYSFRARAKNIYGWGEYSQQSAVVVMSALTIVAETQSVGVILGVIALGILILGTFGFLFIYVYHRKLKEKPALVNSLPSERREVELATLRELPVGSSFIHQSNILYAAGDFILDLELAGVPKVTSNQIRRTRFLGKGAFGEVYEGLATNVPGIHDNTHGTRVAIKTLRKGASNQDKIEFIQEAKLMTQFRHPHILQLLGICIEMDPCCLLLELMGGGDLLAYLRSNRTNPGLTLFELIRMCVDVARGCVYLEDMHFVHRDIAARNCLVRIMDSTSPNPTSKHRVVKIGDFGLARDIYRNDYYRKEGEGLLPVRWMPPESLVDGIFTIQSDIWAFGVLLWEILTLGQQPYPARSNLEVLHYVTAGGTLNQPANCPAALSSLMLQCWEFESENRPSFKDCLAQLEVLLQNDTESFYPYPTNEQIPPHQNFHNFDSENPVEKSSYWEIPEHSERDNDSVFGAVVPVLGPDYMSGTPIQLFNKAHDSSGSFPKYLEVLGGEVGNHESVNASHNPSVEEDGYEIPLPRIPSRNPRNFNPITCPLGIPSPPYWNTKPSLESSHDVELQYFVPFKNSSRSMATVESESETESHYRNLLPSSTSEDADGDVDVDADNECLSSDEQPESLTNHNNYNNNIFNLNLNPSLLQRHCRNNHFQHYEIPPHMDNVIATIALSPEVPSTSNTESDYDYNQFHHHYYNNRPCVNAANSG